MVKIITSPEIRESKKYNKAGDLNKILEQLMNYFEVEMVDMRRRRSPSSQDRKRRDLSLESS